MTKRAWQIRGLSGALLLAMLLVALPASATNGFLLFGYGARSVGMGGGGAALPQDGLVVVNNPAGLVEVADGFDLGLMVFNPRVRSTVGTNSWSSSEKFFPMPDFSFVRHITPDLAWGVALYGSGGFGSRFKDNLFTGDPDDDVAIHILNTVVAPTLSWRFHPKHSIGFTPLLTYQQLSLRGLNAFQCFTPTAQAGGGCPGVPNTPSTQLTNNGFDESFGVGFRLGWLGQVLPRMTLGVAYSTKVKMERFPHYAELLPEQGRLDLPAIMNVGAAFDMTPKTKLSPDWMKVMYEDTNAFGNPGVGLATGLLGADDGPGFGWNNQHIFKLGVVHERSDRWTWRAGANYGKNQIPARSLPLNTISGPIAEKHLMAGFTYTRKSGDEITLAFVHVLRNSQTLPAGPLVGAVRVTAKQDAIAFSYSWR
ncbi:MAG: outer membrane protein transport protein [Gammaproteobacteria bacterium]|nr:outer membrane protein transport protein [Gammaproteobacteria bacterium]